MITVDDLKQIYCPEYISDADGVMVVTEKQNTNPKALSEITFKFNGHIIYIKQDILDKSKDIYKNNQEKVLCLNKICDGVLILDKPDLHYIIYLEMKSSFSDVRKKAILQIPPSYLKINSLLKGFTSFDKSQYLEMGLIVSYPPKEFKMYDSDENSKIMAYKKMSIMNDSREMAYDMYNSILREHHVVEFKGKDFNMNKFHNICPEMLFKELTVVHHPVPNYCVKADINLDDVLGVAYKRNDVRGVRLLNP